MDFIFSYMIVAASFSLLAFFVVFIPSVNRVGKNKFSLYLEHGPRFLVTLFIEFPIAIIPVVFFSKNMIDGYAEGIGELG